jgi:hypothetical protein
MASELVGQLVKAAAHGIRIVLTPVVIDEIVDEFEKPAPVSKLAEKRRKSEQRQNYTYLAFGGLLVVGSFCIIVFT